MGYLLTPCGINTKSFTLKKTKMKKVFALIAIVGFVACNNAEADATKAAADSTAKAAAEKATADSIAALTPAVVDTTKKADTTKAATAPVEAPKH
jgi:hypothetical protein